MFLLGNNFRLAVAQSATPSEVLHLLLGAFMKVDYKGGYSRAGAWRFAYRFPNSGAKDYSESGTETEVDFKRTMYSPEEIARRKKNARRKQARGRKLARAA
jgi:hypothetical protein